MPETVETQLDELRRRARRRLVGAIVLALAAAVFVPMLLESEPKPLGEDVSVKIPPIDDGRFVTKLGEKARPVEPAVKPPPAPAKPAESVPAAKEASLPPKPAAEPLPPKVPASEPPATAPPKPSTEPPKPTGGAFSVQLAAFADDKGANALANRLKKAGHPAYTEAFTTSRGTLWRVRVGPYPTRDAAESARNRLKADGQSGIIAAAN